MSRLRRALAYPRTMGRVGRGTLLSATGLILRAIVQGAYLILLSRWMGPGGYGLFSGVVAAAVVIAPLAGWGVLLLLTERVAADQAHAGHYWQTALRRVSVTGALLAFVYVVAMAAWLPASVGLTVLAMVALAELVLLPLSQAAAALCLALGKAAAAAVIVMLVPLGRLMGLLVIAWLELPTDAATVVGLYFAGSLVGALAAMLVVASLLDWRLRLAAWPLASSRHDGTRYALGAGLWVAYQEVDKVLLLQLAGSAIAGQYTAAFRIASVFVLPIAALLGMALPRLFSAPGETSSWTFMRALLVSSVAYGAAASVGMLLIAPWLPFLLGAGFDAASGYILMLAPWPLLFALHQIFAAGLTASGRQGQRIAIESAVLLASVAANFLFIPVFGGGCAAVTLLAAECLMALACAMAWRRSQAGGASPRHEPPKQRAV